MYSTFKKLRMSTRPSPSILRRSGDFSTADKKSESPRTPKVFKQIMLMELPTITE